MKINKPSMTIGAKTKINKPLSYLKASLVLTAIIFLGYNIATPAQALSPVRCDEWCNTFPESETVEPSMKLWVKNEVEKANLNWDEVYCLIYHESRFDPFAYYANTNGAGVDRGLYQFSDYWHPEISSECAFDYKCATKHFIKIRVQDGNYHQWWGYKNGGCARFIK